jgi:hypothetical protein
MNFLTGNLCMGGGKYGITGILPTIDNSSVLRSLIVKMSTAQTAAEAREHLLAVVEADEE